MNQIIIKGLEVRAHIGVPDEERRQLQVLLVDLAMETAARFEKMDDDLARTIDYDAAARRIQDLAAHHPRRLIETLAAEIAEMALREFHATRAQVEIRKRILPGTDYVAVRCARPAGEKA